MYWSILEVGLALIAACLPSLSSLATTSSVQSAVKSVRSVLSLHSSKASSRVDDHKDSEPYADLERNSSNSSRAGFAKAGLHTARARYDFNEVELAESPGRSDPLGR